MNCVNFGQGPLSDPLLVEAIEDLFVPVAVHNNKKGKDAAILKRYKEPAWNNPVVRYLNADGKDLIPRKDRVWTTSGTAQRMIAALEATHHPVPGYLRIVAAESRPNQKTATFAMACYWTGEARLGAIDGVVSTRAAWRDGNEVVELSYDPNKVSYEKLVAEARKQECARWVYAHEPEQLAAARKIVGKHARRAKANARSASASDQKFYLRKSYYRYLPLTPMQAMRVNVALASRSATKNAAAKKWLSPRQITLARQIESIYVKNPKALEGLRAPDSVHALPAYTKQLEARLARAQGR